jgi:hypothetical protein
MNFDDGVRKIGIAASSLKHCSRLGAFLSISMRDLDAERLTRRTRKRLGAEFCIVRISFLLTRIDCSRAIVAVVSAL